MNAKKIRILILILLVCSSAQRVTAGLNRTLVQRGNELYALGDYNEAIIRYDQVLAQRPEAAEPKFNKANSYYRLDNVAEAMEQYRGVAADSKDIKLIGKAKYNLGNSYFQRAMGQKDTAPQKALEDLKTSVGLWRQVLDLDSKNQNAAKNIEVARLTAKQIKDQADEQKQQSQDPNQPQDPNQSEQQPQDPNQSQQQQPQDPNQMQDPNQQQPQPQQSEEDEKEKQQPPDAKAQEILEKEQKERKQRQILQRARWKKVEKDW